MGGREPDAEFGRYDGKLPGCGMGAVNGTIGETVAGGAGRAENFWPQGSRTVPKKGRTEPCTRVSGSVIVPARIFPALIRRQFREMSQIGCRYDKGADLTVRSIPFDGRRVPFLPSRGNSGGGQKSRLALSLVFAAIIPSAIEFQIQQ